MVPARSKADKIIQHSTSRTLGWYHWYQHHTQATSITHTPRLHQPSTYKAKTRHKTEREQHSTRLRLAGNINNPARILNTSKTRYNNNRVIKQKIGGVTRFDKAKERETECGRFKGSALLLIRQEWINHYQILASPSTNLAPRDTRLQSQATRKNPQFLGFSISQEISEQRRKRERQTKISTHERQIKQQQKTRELEGVIYKRDRKKRSSVNPLREQVLEGTVESSEVQSPDKHTMA